EVRNRLLDAEKQGVRKVIVDLRECGRGPVSEAISLARLFVPSGTISTLRGQTVSAQVFSAEPKQVVWRNTVSVLIDATTSGDDDAAPAQETQKEPGLGPRPLSPEDPIFHRALDLLKTPVKKAA